jgi:hypothetical protein
MRIPIIIASCLLASTCMLMPSCGSAEVAPVPKAHKEVAMSSPAITNACDYADLRATSYLPYVPAQGALIVWPQEGTVSASGRSPIGLTNVDDKLLVRYSDYLELRKRGNGELVWGREVHSGVDCQARPDGVLTRDFAGSYQLITYDSQLIDGVALPFLGERSHLNWVLNDSDEIRYAYLTAPIPVHGPSGTAKQAAGIYARYLAAEERLLWFFERPGAARGARLSSDGKTVCLGTLNFIDIFPANADSNTSLISLPVVNLRALAINHEGKLLALDSFEEKLRLRCLGLDGKELWSIFLKTDGDITQPPASAPGARTWVAVGTTIYQFVENNLIWEYTIPAAGRVFMTACADNTLLIACGSHFTRLSEHGEPLVNRVLAGTLTCRPLVDDQGRIFLGGSGGVFCLR